MENRIVATSCRVCLRETKNLGSLYETSHEGYEPPNKMLQLITGITIEEMDEYDNLPKSICKNCEFSLHEAFIFRENVLKTQQIIDAYFKKLNENYDFEDNHPSVVMIKREFEDINLEPMDSLGPIKEEFQYLSNDQNKYSVENDELNKVVQSGNICGEKQQETALFRNESKQNNENINGKKENTEDGYTSDEDEFDYTEDNFEIMPADGENYAVIQINLTKAKSVKSIKTNTRQSMEEKRKRHDKAGRFICVICCKKFLTFKLLRKHMSSQCSDKSFKCKFCSRTFSSKGNQERREMAHGSRDYICDVCSKRRYYSHPLKSPKLTHEDIKAYHCEYCNKDFRLKHHKRNHELTKTHQNTVRIAKLSNLSLLHSGQLKNQECLNESIIFKKEIADDQLAGES